MFSSFTKPKSVDQVLSAFTSAMQDLDDIADAQTLANTAALEEIEAAKIRADIAHTEATRARSVRAKIKALIS